MKVTLLKVPHHGGRSSADPDFIGALSPAISVISVGIHNPYHHPSPETLRIYNGIPTRIFRTDHEGALLFRTDGENYDAETFRSLAPVKAFLWNGGWKEEVRNGRRFSGSGIHSSRRLI